MLTKTDIVAIQVLLKPLIKDIAGIKRGLHNHMKASHKEHARLQQSINRLVDVYDADQTKNEGRLTRIEKTLGFASV